MLHINMLGSFEVIRAGDSIDAKAWGRRKNEQLLKYFAAYRGRAITQEQLIEAIYPEQPNNKSLRNLLGRISELRRILEPDLRHGRDSRFIVRISQGTYTLPHDAPCKIDMETFRDEVSAGMEFAGAESWENAIGHLERATRLYRGDFLEEDVYEEWTIALRDSLGEQFRGVLHTLGLAQRKIHAFSKAIEYYDRAIGLNRLDEAAYRGKMLALYHAGDPAGAEDVYEACIRRLKEDELEPHPETRGLYGEVLKRAIPREIPPVRNNLPRYATSFFGRKPELSRILSILQGGDNPFLTLLGPGGIGKTRLAVEAASRALEQYKDGIFFVAVPHQASADQLLAGIAEAVDIQLQRGEEPRNQLIGGLRGKQILLIMDNGEHAHGAVGLLEEIVQETRVHVIATTRERLRVSGETIMEIEGLHYFKEGENGVLGHDQLASYDAFQLFCDRMRRVNHHFEMTPEVAGHVTRICRIAQGMPLAIELAATWGRVLSCKEIAKGIEQSAGYLESLSPETAPEHRSMKAVFEYTWARLSPEEQSVFGRLCVFKEGMSTTAALKIGACSLSTIMALRDKALIQRTPSDRYAIHELLRQFGEERLRSVPSEWKVAYHDHADYFTNLVVRHTKDLFGSGQAKAMGILHADAGNVLAAWKWNVSVGNYMALSSAARGYFRYHEIQDRWHELRTVIDDTLDALEGDESGSELDNLLAFCYLHKGIAVTFASDLTLGMEYLTKALDLSRKIGDRLLHGEGLMEIGTVQYTTGDYDKAELSLTASVKILRQLGERHATGRALAQLGVLHRHRREHDRAMELFAECLIIFRELEDPTETAGALLNIGTAYGSTRQRGKALEHFEECHEIAQMVGHRNLMLMSLANIGYLAYMERDFTVAKAKYREALKLTEESSNLKNQPQLFYYLCLVCAELGEYDEALSYGLEGLSIASELRSPPLILRNIYALGFFKRAQGHLEEAAGLMSFAVSHPAIAGPTRVGIEADLKGLSEDLPPEVVERAEKWAKSMSLEAVVDWAQRKDLGAVRARGMAT